MNKNNFKIYLLVVVEEFPEHRRQLLTGGGIGWVAGNVDALSAEDRAAADSGGVSIELGAGRR